MFLIPKSRLGVMQEMPGVQRVSEHISRLSGRISMPENAMPINSSKSDR